MPIASLNVLAIDPKIACSCFDIDIARHQSRTFLVRAKINAPK
jgi:hypothetical protein